MPLQRYAQYPSATTRADSSPKNGGGLTGLAFPGYSDGNTIRFRFTGAALQPMFDSTYIWRAYPKAKTNWASVQGVPGLTAYCTIFFWGNDGAFAWGSNNNLSYYGPEPYPNPNTSDNCQWEIAANSTDIVDGDVIDYDRWYIQALRAYTSGADKFLEFYWDLPDTTKKVESGALNPYGTAPPSPALTWGDAPWTDQAPNGGEGREMFYGYLRGIQTYDANLSLTDIANEIASPGSVRTPWYLNLNPTPSDISDKSGSGHNPAWVGAERPGIWTG